MKYVHVEVLSIVDKFQSLNSLILKKLYIHWHTEFLLQPQWGTLKV